MSQTSLLRTRCWAAARRLLVGAGALAWACCLAGTVHGSDLPPLLDRAIGLTETNRIEEWAYTRTTLSKGIRVVERFDPASPRGQRWSLVETNGRPASAEEAAAYREAKKAAAEKAAREEAEKRAAGEETASSSPLDLRKLIDSKTLKLLRESPEKADYEFGVIYEYLGVNLGKHVTGKLTVDKTLGTLESLEFGAENAFSPLPSVKMQEFKTVLKFEPILPGGPVLLRSLRTRALGTVLFVRPVDENSIAVYTDFRKPPTPVSAP